MIEFADIIISTLLGSKIAGDEFFRRRNGKSGKNGLPALSRRLGVLEKKVDDVGGKVDMLREGVRDDIRQERTNGEAAHRELHEKINTCAQGVAELKGEMKGLTRGGAPGD